MKRFILLFIVCFTFLGCEYYPYPDYVEFDRSYNPMFRTQWTVLSVNGTFKYDNEVIIDFDLYDDKSLTIYENKKLISRSYNIERVSTETWVIRNFNYDETYCTIVIQISDFYNGNADYGCMMIYKPNNVLYKKYVISRNYNYLDINSYL